jgi:excinuclease UvrABC nuclease subunit
VTNATDAALDDIPDAPAVYLIWLREGEPYLGRTALLRRRLRRLRRLLGPQATVRRLEYQLAGSALELSVVLYEQARLHFPTRYLELMRLRLPPYVKLLLDNPFPRSAVTTRLSRAPGLYFGPFATRAAAEKFEAGFLDLFQVRRCQENLAPAPDHAGCMYGEMGMCLRPCQQVVGPAEYGHEAARAAEFLRTCGASLGETLKHSRDRFSEEMQFEAAARVHKRLEKVQEVAAMAGDLARALDRLDGVAVTGSVVPGAVDLWFVREGHPQPPARFATGEDGQGVSLDRRLRELIAAIEFRRTPAREQAERMALVARWHYASWRQGEWIGFPGFDQVPYRRLVNAISRVARASCSV